MKRLSMLLCCVAALALVAPARGADAAAGAQAQKKEAAKKAPVNKVCPVTGEDVDASQTVAYQGKLVAFCCEECVAEFNKDPKKFAKQVEAAEKQAKEQQKKDAAKKKDGQAKKGEKPEPAKPVNALCVVHPEDAVDPTVTAEYEGKLIGFCCVDCREKFDLDPERYAARLKK